MAVYTPIFAAAIPAGQPCNVARNLPNFEKEFVTFE